MRKFIRKYIYPFLNYFETLIYRRLYSVYRPNLIIGPRGNDYARHRRRLNKIKKMRGKKILIAGAGTGSDLYSYFVYRPSQLICVDLFDWREIYKKIKKEYPEIRIIFYQANLEKLKKILSESIDIYSSDAVLEHCQNLEAVLKEAVRVLKKGGIFYATFGPLYYCYGGDHLSGYDSFSSGYNHLLLNEKDYQDYVTKWTPQTEVLKPEDNSKIWVENKLFSYLRVSEYLNLLESCFKRLFLQFEVEPKALRWLKKYPEKKNFLLKKYNLELIDLITKSISFIGENVS